MICCNISSISPVIVWISSLFTELWLTPSIAVLTTSVRFLMFSLKPSTVWLTFLITNAICLSLFWDSDTDCLDSSDSLRIFSATTAKPFPASPALAASMLAFKDNRLMYLAICSTFSDISLYFPAFTLISCIPVKMVALSFSNPSI